MELIPVSLTNDVAALLGKDLNVKLFYVELHGSGTLIDSSSITVGHLYIVHVLVYFVF